MRVWYLDHSGFAVETQRHLLVFDYYTDLPKGGTLEQGAVTPELLPADKQLVVFVSHGHFDHYNKVVHSWQAQRPHTLLFFGEDIPASPETITVPCGDTVTVEGIRVTALRSTDQGAAFLVQVDGRCIYHGGDLNWWHWEGEQEAQNQAMAVAYTREVDKLRGQQIDLAMLAVDPRLGPTAFWGAQYFMRRVGAAFMIPMHLWEEYSTCALFAQDPENAAIRDKIAQVNHRGQCFDLPG